MRYNLSLMLAFAASERREAAATEEGRATEPARKAAYDDEPWVAPDFRKPTRGRVVSQAKGPNRAQRRGR